MTGLPVELISIGALVVSSLGFLWTIFGAYGDLKGRVISLETKMDLFWTHVQKGMGMLIKQPIHFRKDELIDRFNADNKGLSIDELCELRDILMKEMKELEKVKNDRIIAYTLYLAGVEQEILKRNSPKLSFWQKFIYPFSRETTGKVQC